MTTEARVRAGSMWRWSVACLGAVSGAFACGTAAMGTGTAAGAVGRDLTRQSQGVPRGAEVCAMQKALAGPGLGTDKPIRETCAEAARSEALWRNSMIVLGAYTDHLEAVAGGASPKTAGPLAAARTGITSPTWIDVEDPGEIDARAAVANLVGQLAEAGEAKKDLDQTVKAAAPHVETLCKGLDPYFDAQLAALSSIQKDVEKRRTTRADHRCGMLDNRSICVGESAQDRLDQGTQYGELAALTRSYLDAKNALARFCAAHEKLAEAATKGKVKSSDTAAALVSSVKSAKITTLEDVQEPSEAAGSDAAAPAKAK
ncbi:MAG: hypothetical protein JW751_09470 [Polyangiaceae bacterium]|nr:hypothetical protein [Polyangiaceae bacterium]